MTWNISTNKVDVSGGTTLQIAGVGTGGNLGGVRVDGNKNVINATGVISSVQTQVDWNNTDASSRTFIANKPQFLTSIPVAGTSVSGTLGGVRVDVATITIDGSGVTRTPVDTSYGKKTLVVYITDPHSLLVLVKLKMY
jgi:hypothetical protein